MISETVKEDKVFGKPHHFDNEVDFRYLSEEECTAYLKAGFSPPITYLTATGFCENYDQTCSVIEQNVFACSSEYCLLNTSHDPEASAKIWAKSY